MCWKIKGMTAFRANLKSIKYIGNPVANTPTNTRVRGCNRSFNKALQGAYQESAFRLQRCQCEGLMCKITVYVTRFNTSRKQNFKTPCWAFRNPINFYWFFYQIEIVSVNVQLPLDVTIIIVVVGVYSKGPVQTPLHSCAEPNWWIKSGKRAASESVRYVRQF